MSYDTIRDAPQEGPSQSTQAPATDDYDPHLELLTQVDDLLGRASEAQVGLGDRAARGPDPLCLLVEQSLGVAPQFGGFLLGEGVERR